MNKKEQTALSKLISYNIKHRRLELGLTQQEVADSMRVPQYRISRLEKGIFIPELVTLFNLAKPLKCKLLDFFAVDK